MKKTCSEYTSSEISRFVDNELAQDLQKELAIHLGHCRECSRLFRQYTAISAQFSDHADEAVSKIDSARLKQNLEHLFQKPAKPSPGNSFGFSGKNIYLKLASIAAILMISIFTLQGKFSEPPGPSAIVKSIDTDFSSVMIIETQKEKHTIIWFSET